MCQGECETWFMYKLCIFQYLKVNLVCSRPKYLDCDTRNSDKFLIITLKKNEYHLQSMAPLGLIPIDAKYGRILSLIHYV